MKANLKEVTPHVLRHTFASIAGDLGFSELTIAGLLGHSARGVTQGYIHLDTALIVAADRVSAEIEKLLDGMNDTRKSNRSIEKTFTSKVA
jgi:integrase